MCDLLEDDDDRRELAKCIDNRLSVLAELAALAKPGIRLADTELGESVRRCNALTARLKQLPAFDDDRDRLPADSARGGTGDT